MTQPYPLLCLKTSILIDVFLYAFLIHFVLQNGIYINRKEQGGERLLLSELAEKELIQVKDGARYGKLADTELLFNPQTGKIEGFEVFQKTASFFQSSKANKKKEFISWNEIILIGKDRILFNETDSSSESSAYS